jgi:cell division transport system permease protein
LINFYRNTFVSFASVMMMTVTLFIIGATIFLNAILSFTITNIERKVDVNVYFYPQAAETRILEIKASLEQLPQVAKVEYVSREDALNAFRARHENDQLTLQALDELGGNPLGASLNVQAKDSGQYESIAEFLNSDSTLSAGAGNNLIEKINYYQNKEIINRLNSLADTVKKVGIILTILFVGLSMIVTLNTIRSSCCEPLQVGADNQRVDGVGRAIIWHVPARLDTPLPGSAARSAAVRSGPGPLVRRVPGWRQRSRRAPWWR